MECFFPSQLKTLFVDDGILFWYFQDKIYDWKFKNIKKQSNIYNHLVIMIRKLAGHFFDCSNLIKSFENWNLSKKINKKCGLKYNKSFLNS